ncbi:MAG: Lrp/AsnC family transcriptional regulator [Nanoarchaeota archaeon]|nr:Lrp/AsnC family transcriptional regulator [Nanoarchaeota archaeon]MBU1643564.1 Lrp/AsnC family transcriptional regulator [Nanoarchaeota archaeon]MBU1976782.1 Lrp/AsnC family transcriptional regulator [Nanoarchaeota archaeon]
MEVDLDDKDKQILEVLQEHADYTTRQIAKKTLLPATTIHNRIRKLKKDGVIKKFTLELDNNKVGKGFSAYILVSVDLQLLKQKKKTQYDVAKDLRKFAFVERADIVSGGTDIVAIVRVKDVEEFDSILLKKLQLVEGIEKTQSLIVIHGE